MSFFIDLLVGSIVGQNPDYSTSFGTPTLKEALKLLTYSS